LVQELERQARDLGLPLADFFAENVEKISKLIANQEHSKERKKQISPFVYPLS
jgi:hypothetical protein